MGWQVAVLVQTVSGHDRNVELVPLNRMSFQQRIQVLDMALKTKDMDNEHFLQKVRARLDRSDLSCKSNTSSPHSTLQSLRVAPS